MANNIPQFKIDFLAFFTSTATFDAATKTKFRDAIVQLYNPEWIIYLAGGADTAVKRGEFAVKKIYDWMKQQVEQASYNNNVTALPAPDTIS